jgi:hypothetical protein
MTPLKRVLVNFLSNFSGVNDTAEMAMTIMYVIFQNTAETISAVSLTAEIYKTPLKFQTDFTSPFFPLMGKSSKNISMTNIPRLYKYSTQKSWRLPKPHFRFQRCQ